jgi:hypothetical protein
MSGKTKFALSQQYEWAANMWRTVSCNTSTPETYEVARGLWVNYMMPYRVEVDWECDWGEWHERSE